MRKWVKKGLIFKPNKRFYWMQSHAQVPTVDFLGSNIYRIYFASRDKNQKSHIGYFDFNIEKLKILKISKKPVLVPGEIGFFDEDGVYPSSIINIGKKKYLYYIGWSKGAKPPLYHASIGLAISEDGGKTFYKYSRAPILGKSEYDPCLVTSPFVIKIKNDFRMYYASGFKWKKIKGTLRSFYNIKIAQSTDGINWKRNGIVAIDFLSSKETNITRLSPLKTKSGYEGWYTYATLNTPYRLGYAVSRDGVKWIRKDNEVGVDVSKRGFDNKMICYPFVIVHKKKKYMFYNGNNFGENGIALAIYEEK